MRGKEQDKTEGVEEEGDVVRDDVATEEVDEDCLIAVDCVRAIPRSESRRHPQSNWSRGFGPDGRCRGAISSTALGLVSPATNVREELPEATHACITWGGVFG